MRGAVDVRNGDVMTRIAILHPGEMGSATGSALIAMSTAV
jgi:hypothetical protein